MPPSSAQAKAPKLPNFLCFAVYSANLAFGRVYKPLLDKLGLTYTSYIALVALGDEDDLTVSALGEKLFLESNTLTPILKKLETMDLVRRRRDPADERQVRISLTDAGRHLLARIETEASPELINAAGLGSDDFSKVRKAVAGLRDNLLRSLHAGGQDVP
jgi:MarR family transcriptional regulator, organic hydroperoxide resistance regulator